MKQLINFIFLFLFFSIVNSATLSAQAKYERNSSVCFYDDQERKWFSGTYQGWDNENNWHTVKYKIGTTTVTASFYDNELVASCPGRCGCSGSTPISNPSSGGGVSYEANSAVCYYDKDYDQWRKATYVGFIKSKKQHEIKFFRGSIQTTIKMPFEDRISSCPGKCGCSDSSPGSTNTGNTNNPNNTGNTSSSNSKGRALYEEDSKVCYYDNYSGQWRQATYLGFDHSENLHRVRFYRNRMIVTSSTYDESRMSTCPGKCGCSGSAPIAGNTGNTTGTGNTGNNGNTGNTGNTDNTSSTAAYYRIENFDNPRFIKLDNEKAKKFIDYVDKNLDDNKKDGKEPIFPKNFQLTDMGSEVYAIKTKRSNSGSLQMSLDYNKVQMMNPNDTYNPTHPTKITGQMSAGIGHLAKGLTGSQQEGFVILKAEDLDPENPPRELTNWAKNTLKGVFDNPETKLKLNVSGNELSLCLDAGNIHTFKVQNGKLNKVRSLDIDDDLVAFSRGGGNKYCIVTSDGNADKTNIHFFKGASDIKETKNLKIWDEHREDNLKDRPYPTLDYANGEYLLQYYVHMWESKMNTNLHSGSFRLRIKEDGSADTRQWQTSHTFGMDALHNGTDWVSLYSTDGDMSTNHPGVIIDKVDSRQKALLFSSPQRWAERGQGDAAHGQMNYFYTGLGGIAHDGSGYGVVFNNPKMKTAPADLPQNVGYVYVKEEFEATSRRKKGDSNVDPTNNLLNAGATDNVVIYTEKMNTDPVNYKRKVKWLSNYTSLENGFANNTDIVAIGNKFIVVWEKWAKVGEVKDWGEMVPVWDFQSTEAVVIDKMGNVLSSKSLGKHPLNDWDDLHVQNGKVVWAIYDNGSVLLNTLDTNLNHKVTTLALP